MNLSNATEVGRSAALRKAWAKERLARLWERKAAEYMEWADTGALPGLKLGSLPFEHRRTFAYWAGQADMRARALHREAAKLRKA